MKKYKSRVSLAHEGKPVRSGEIVELSDERAKRLLDKNFIELVEVEEEDSEEENEQENEDTNETNKVPEDQQEDSYPDYSKQELMELGEELGVDLKKSMSRKEMIILLDEAEEG